ncbi:MAG: hypothetical protein QW158_07050 [Nitrososphaerales archaeon]
MEETPIILPYALDEDKKGWIKGFTKDVESALFFLFLEQECKRLFKKSRYASKIALVSKIYYSAWITPWKDGKGLVIDALELFPQAFCYDELQSFEDFVEDLERSRSGEEYLDTLRRHTFTFFSVKASRPFILSLISNKDLVSELQRYILHYKKESVVNALSLSPKVSWQQVSTFVKMLREAEAEIEALGSVRKKLTALTSEWVNKLKEESEKVQKEYQTLIEEARVTAKLEDLRVMYQSKVSELEKKMDEEVKSLLNEQQRLQSEIQQLQQKRSECLKMLKTLQQSREALLKQLNAPQSRRNEISNEIEEQLLKLENLKMEQIRLEGLAEEQKGVASELSVTRERLSKLSLEINRVNEVILRLKKELGDEDEKRLRLQEEIVNLNKQISDIEKAIKDLDASTVENKAQLASIPHQIEDFKKRRHDEILRVDREYRLKSDEVRLKIAALQLEMAIRLEALRRRIDEIRWRSNEITAQVERLIELKRSFIHSFYGAAIYLPKSLELEAPTLIQIPLYLVCFETLTERRYSLYTPIKVKQVYKTPWSKKLSLEIMLKSFDRVVKERLYEVMKQNYSFEEEVLNSCARLNLLRNHDFLTTLLEGLGQLKLRGWLSTRDADKVIAILSDFILPKTDKKWYESFSLKIRS